MAYQKINFQNEPSTLTPVSAENLNHMEDGIYSAQAAADQAQAGVDSLNTRSFAPIPVELVADMTDETKNYLYLGSETGYESGYLYYWNGTAWTKGNEYQTGQVVTDPTLSGEGQAADAKAAGDAITSLRSALTSIATFVTIDENNFLDSESTAASAGQNYISDLYLFTDASNGYVKFAISAFQNQYNEASYAGFTLYGYDSENTRTELHFFPFTGSGIKDVDYVNTTNKYELRCKFDFSTIPVGTRYTTINDANIVAESHIFDWSLRNNKPAEIKTETLPDDYFGFNELADLMVASCNVAPKKILTWVDDDTSYNRIPLVKSICDELGIHATFACIPPLLNTVSGLTDRLLGYQLAGHHIALHTDTDGWIRQDGQGHMVDAAEAEELIVTYLKTLLDAGFLDPYYYVYGGGATYNSNGASFEGLAKKYMNTGVIANNTTISRYGYQEGRWKIPRLFIRPATSSEVSYYTDYLDSFDDSVGSPWVVFGTHSGNSDEWDTDRVKSVMQYAINNGWTVMTLSEAYRWRKKFYNIQEMLGK